MTQIALNTLARTKTGEKKESARTTFTKTATGLLENKGQIMWGKHTLKNEAGLTAHQTSFSDIFLKHTPASSETIIHITPRKLQAVSAEPLHV